VVTGITGTNVPPYGAQSPAPVGYPRGAPRLAITRTHMPITPFGAAPNGIWHTVAAAHSLDQASIHCRIGPRGAGQTVPVAALAWTIR
jgi:hypothetical protein